MAAASAEMVESMEIDSEATVDTTTTTTATTTTTTTATPIRMAQVL